MYPSRVRHKAVTGMYPSQVHIIAGTYLSRVHIIDPSIPNSICANFYNISSKTWREEVRATDDAGIIIVSNPSTEFANNILLNMQSYNNWLESCCINVGGRRRTKMIILLI